MGKRIVCLVFLYLLARQDCHDKEISSWLLDLFIGSGFVCRMVQKEWMEQAGVMTLFWALLPGCLLLVLGILSREKIGYGDGLSVLALGFYEDVLFVIQAVNLGFLLAVFWFCMKKQKSRKADGEAEIAYLPFLLTGTVVMYGAS